MPKAVTIDRIPFVKTPIPPILDYPIESLVKSYNFLENLINMMYNPAYLAKVKAALGLAKASMF